MSIILIFALTACNEPFIEKAAPDAVSSDAYSSTAAVDDDNVSNAPAPESGNSDTDNAAAEDNNEADVEEPATEAGGSDADSAPAPDDTDEAAGDPEPQAGSGDADLPAATGNDAEQEAGNTAVPDFTSYVRITVNGSSFAPSVELAGGSSADVAWYVEETGDIQKGLTPSFTFGTEGVRHVRMAAVNPDGTNALGDIVTFNVGFNHLQDAGKYNIGSGYDYTSQCVTGLSGVNAMKGLVRFLAATPTLRGALDFGGMRSLQYIECYGAQVSAVNLTGCTSLIRLCMELNDLAALDLNPVSGCLRDLRMSGNQSTVTLTPLNAPMEKLYHYCAQSERVINHPTAAQLPVIEEWWDWSSGQTGALIIRSSAINSVITCHNQWTSMDLANQFPEGRNGFVEAYNCNLSEINLTGCAGLTFLDAHGNLLDQSDVDGILEEVLSWGTYDGVLELFDNAPPSDYGMNLVNALQARNWMVTVDTE